MRGSSFTVRQGRSYYTGDGRSTQCKNNCVLTFLGVLVLLIAPAALFYVERTQYQLELAFSELEHQIVEIDTSDLDTCPASGTPVYFTSDFTGSVSDYDFGLTLQHGLLLNRETQYCQWQETSSESCDTCQNNDGSTYKCNCVLTYYYHKGWHNHLIMSATFDQPFNHNNPMRNPFPRDTFASGNTIAGQVSVDAEVIAETRGTPRRVYFKHPSQPAPSYWFWKLFGWKDNQRYEHIDTVRPLSNSPAGNEGFVYTNNEGWFFSAYESTLGAEMLRKFGQYLEGSLFDWQLADLLDTGCTAGDIRVRYSVVDPEAISVVGQFKNKPIEHISMIDNLDSTSLNLGLVHAGVNSYEDMVDAENSIANRNSWIARAVVVAIWSPVLFYMGLVRTLWSGLGAALLTIGLCWAFLYGVFDLTGVSTSVSTIIVLAAGTLLFAQGQFGRSRSRRQKPY